MQDKDFRILDNLLTLYILAIVYFTAGKKHPVMIMDGYEFKLLQRTAASSVWVCTQNVKHRCKVRLLTTGRQIQIKRVNHTHEVTFKGDYKGLGLHSQSVSIVYCEKFNIV